MFFNHLLRPSVPPCWADMLSSFINRRKVKKISLFDAALRRAPSSPSLGIQSDRENSRSKQWASLSKAQASAVTGLRPPAPRKPEVRLDLAPSSSSDRFPQEILAPHDDDGHLPVQPVPQTDTLSVYDDVVVIGPEQVSSVLSLSPRLVRFNACQRLPSSRNPVQCSLRSQIVMIPPWLNQDTTYVNFCVTLNASVLTPTIQGYHHSTSVAETCTGAD